MSHSVLDCKKVLDTIVRLQMRIEDRFPGSGLGRVCGELIDIARQTDQTIRSSSSPATSTASLFLRWCSYWL